MKAITVEPKKPGTARLEEVPEPEPGQGSVLVEAIGRLGVPWQLLISELAGQGAAGSHEPKQ